MANPQEKVVLALEEELAALRMELIETETDVPLPRIAVFNFNRRPEDADTWELEKLSDQIIFESRDNELMLKACTDFFLYAAANTVQKVWRGHLERATFARKDAIRQRAKRSAAARRIQILFRGYLGREVAHEAQRREDAYYPAAAAVQIQRVARGYMTRRIITERRNRILAAQEVFDRTRGAENHLGSDSDSTTDSDDKADYDQPPESP